VLDTAKQFPRWLKGYCICFKEENNPDTAEKFIPFTFFEDVNDFPVITEISCKIVQQKEEIMKKINSLGEARKLQIKNSKIYEKNHMNSYQKTLEKG
jgi:hypothetical protein